MLCLALTRQQIGYWKDSEALFRHALEVTENNDASASHNLGAALDKKAKLDEAIRQYQEALRLKPDYAQAHYNLGVALDKKGQIDEAIRQLPGSPPPETGLRRCPLQPRHCLGKKGQTGRGHPPIPGSHPPDRMTPTPTTTSGAALDQKGQMDEAIRQFQEALRLKPDHAEAHYNLGVALGKQGQTDEAIRHSRKPCDSSRTMPRPARTWTLRSPPKAVHPAPPPTAKFQRTLRLSPGPEIDVPARSLGQSGRRPVAVTPALSRGRGALMSVAEEPALLICRGAAYGSPSPQGEGRV